MTEPLAIRPAIVADFAPITAIYAHYVRTHLATFELEPPALAEMRARHRATTRAGFPYLVAVAGTRVLGYAYAAHYRLRPAYRHSVEDSIYVDPESTGRGVGSRLLAALVESCAAQGYRQMIAVIGDSANHASIRLHARCGFASVGTLPAVGFKFGRWVDSVLMQRALGAGAETPPAL